MSSKLIARSFALLELLVQHPQGLGVTELSAALGMPKGTTHRLLGDLMDMGYIRLVEPFKLYQLTLKLVQLGFQSLAANSMVEVAQPLLTQLADLSGELVRLSLIDQDRLIFIAKAQGAPSGLRIDPDMGQEARLGYSAAGLAWLSTLEDDAAQRLICQQHVRLSLTPDAGDFGQDLTLLKQQLATVRQRQHSRINNSMGAGTAAMAAPILNAKHTQALGVISIAGPSVRLTPEHMDSLLPNLLQTTATLATLSIGLSFTEA